MLLPSLPLEAVLADPSLAKRYGVLGPVLLQPTTPEKPLPQECVAW
jgi:hypothetical protein